MKINARILTLTAYIYVLGATGTTKLMMQFYFDSLGGNGDVEIFRDSKLFIRVRQKNYFRSYSKFYKDDRLIFESRFTYLFIWRKVKILFQDLAVQIDSIETSPLRDADLYCENAVFSMESHVFSKKQWLLFNDGIEIGSVKIAKKISLGAKYNIEINTDDDHTAICFLILFTSSLTLNNF